MFSVAKQRLRDTIREHRAKGESAKASTNRKMTVNDVAMVYLAKVNASVSLKLRSKGYREMLLGFIRQGAGREPEPLNRAAYRIRADDGVGEGSLKQKCRDNFVAIELVRRLDEEARAATDEEKRVLVEYVGWGGIPQVFAWHEAPDWQPERERLKELLSNEEYEAARASTLNAHYTAPVVVRAIYDAVERLGFKHERVLELAAGIGHFFGLMPAEMSARSLFTGIELDPLTANIARKLSRRRFGIRIFLERSIRQPDRSDQ